MIEWWHAVLIAFASSLTTGGIALLIQHRQMDRDVKLQQQRLDADAQERKLQAAREHSKEQMRTLYEFVEVVEQHQSSRFLQMNLGRKEHKESVDSILKDEARR